MSKYKSQKFYVIWKGHSTGIFNSWDECKINISQYEGALYKSFSTIEEAEIAFKDNPFKHVGNKKAILTAVNKIAATPIMDSLSVDAACSGNPGVMEYRGVHVLTKQVWFHKRFPLGTNNIGEFLGIVHGLAE
jgi:ribonuclease HI